MVVYPIAIMYVNVARYETRGNTSNAIPRNLWLSFAADQALEHSAGVLTAVNLPGAVIIPLIDWLTLKSVDGPSWRPEDMGWETWRTIVLPIGCIPFWALVGLGIDGILRLRRIRWPWLAAGTVLCVLFLIGTCGMTFGLPPEDRADMRAIIGGFVFWTLLLATFPAYWIRMGLDRRRLRRQSNSLQV